MKCAERAKSYADKLTAVQKTIDKRNSSIHRPILPFRKK